MWEVVASLSDLLGQPLVSAWLRDTDNTFRSQALVGYTEEEAEGIESMEVSGELGDRYLLSTEDPFFIPAEVIAQMQLELRVTSKERPVLVAPIRWNPGGLGALVVEGEDPSATFSSRDIRLARGVADL